MSDSTGSAWRWASSTPGKMAQHTQSVLSRDTYLIPAKRYSSPSPSAICWWGPCGDEPGDAAVWSADEAGVEIAVAKSGKAQCQLAAQHLMGVQVIDVEEPVARVERDLHRGSPMTPAGGDGPRPQVARSLPLVGHELDQVQLGAEAGERLGEAALERRRAVQDPHAGDVEPVAGALPAQIVGRRRRNGERLRVAADPPQRPGGAHRGDVVSHR